MTQDFIHLGVHSDFSLYDSLLSVKKVIRSAKDNGMSSVCINDDSNLFGAIQLYRNAIQSGLKPLIAAELHVDNEGEEGKITVIAKSNRGYKNLINLVSIGYDYGRAKALDMPVIHFEDLERFSEDVIVLSGARHGVVGKAIVRGDMQRAEDIAEKYKSLFGDSYYLELQRTGHSYDELHIQGAIKLALSLGLPVVATNAVRFIEQSQFFPHEVRVSDYHGITVTESRDGVGLDYTPHQYFKTKDEMVALFNDIPSAIENTVHIANRCSVDIDLDIVSLPHFDTPDGVTEVDHLISESKQGLEVRLRQLYPDTYHLDSVRKPYLERLDYELDVIIQMGFPGYFLIVADFVQYSKDSNIEVGAGRGSGAGSLVAYSLKITDLDPLEYDLLFERFLNPERVSMPDFDIDFCMEGRDKVIAYVVNKYGLEAVSQIITFGTLAAKAAVKAAARVMGYPFMVGDRISKLIPKDPGVKLSDALSVVDELAALMSSDNDVQKIINVALELEGIRRQTGKHAGGVLIADGRLTALTPTYRDYDLTGFVSQFDKSDVETAGLVKFDFLGLKTLTILGGAISNANISRAKNGLEPIVLSDLPLDDAATYEMYRQGETTAVFQVESRGMKELLKQLKPDRFEDIIALVALYRPGVLMSGMVDNFIDRKHGREEVSYPHSVYQHESLKPILADTYGIILYQEQVMQIGQTLAGYSLGGADLLRRAMGKKKPEEMERQRSVFRDGAIKQGIDAELAMKIFDLVEKFAGYGFNKSHSAAYALISYQTAYLKQHYPAEFMASVLSADRHDPKLYVPFVHEAKRLGIKVLPPSINESGRGFTCVRSGEIRYGIEAIKAMGDSVVSDVLNERQKSRFTSIFDFISRVKISFPALISSVHAGLFDEFGYTRATLVHNMRDLQKLLKKPKKEVANQTSLFGDDYTEKLSQHIVPQEEFSLADKLMAEMKAIGVSVSGHLLDNYQDDVIKLNTIDLVETIDTSLEVSQDTKWQDKEMSVCGVLSEVNVRTTRSKQKMATMMIDDGARRVPAIMFDKAVNKHFNLLSENSVAFITGKLVFDSKTSSHKIVIWEMEHIERMRMKMIDSLRIDASTMSASDFIASEECLSLRAVLGVKDYGLCPITVECSDGIHAFQSKKIDVGELLLKDLRAQYPSFEFDLVMKPSISVESRAYPALDAVIATSKGFAERKSRINGLLLEARKAMIG
ncbi:DNA polymerase III subunit alpha [Vibrio breoganii]